MRISKNKKDIEAIMKVVTTFGGNSEELATTRKFVELELIELGGNRVLLIEEQGEEVIGVVQLLIKEADGDPTLANGADTAHVHALQVNKNFQRRGHAQKMMEDLEKYALMNNFKKLTLGVDSDNPPALALYDKLGYSLLREEEGRTPEVKLRYLEKLISHGQ